MVSPAGEAAEAQVVDAQRVTGIGYVAKPYVLYRRYGEELAR